MKCIPSPNHAPLTDPSEQLLTPTVTPGPCPWHPRTTTCLPDMLCWPKWPKQLRDPKPLLCSPDHAAHTRMLHGGNKVLTSMLHRHSSNFVTTSENSGLPCEHKMQRCVKSRRRQIFVSELTHRYEMNLSSPVSRPLHFRALLSGCSGI